MPGQKFYKNILITVSYNILNGTEIFSKGGKYSINWKYSI